MWLQVGQEQLGSRTGLGLQLGVLGTWERSGPTSALARGLA